MMPHPKHQILLFALVLSTAVSAATRSIDIDGMLESIREEAKLPALAGAVILDNKIIGATQVGTRKIAYAQFVTPDDKFHLGSCTKAVTGTLAGILVEAGKIKWETTLAQAFPDLAEKMDPAFRAVTLEQLLAHRSGLAADTDGTSEAFKRELAVNNSEESITAKRFKLVKQVLTQKPAQAPGEQFVYANQNYVVAAVMLERAAGLPWERLAADRIFRPLGMKSVGFGPMGTPEKYDQPLQHKVDKDGVVTAIDPLPGADNPEIMTPAGRMHCTVADWAKFILEHVRGEKVGSPILKAETFQKLHTASFGGIYSAGWHVVTRPWAKGNVLTHNGTNTQNFAVVWMAPEMGFAVMAMTNQGGKDAEAACDKFCAAVIAKVLKPVATKNE